MIDRHAVQKMLSAGMTNGQVARHFGVSKRTVRRIRREPSVDGVEDAGERKKRGVGRPRIGPEVRARMRALMEEDLQAPPLEILRLLREEGVRIAESTFYRIQREVRGTLPQALMVRFEGVAAEFARFDSREVEIQLREGRRTRIHFAAYRLKYSRWIGVVLVPDHHGGGPQGRA